MDQNELLHSILNYYFDLHKNKYQHSKYNKMNVEFKAVVLSYDQNAEAWKVEHLKEILKKDEFLENPKYGDGHYHITHAGIEAVQSNYYSSLSNRIKANNMTYPDILDCSFKVLQYLNDNDKNFISVSEVMKRISISDETGEISEAIDDKLYHDNVVDATEKEVRINDKGRRALIAYKFGSPQNKQPTHITHYHTHGDNSPIVGHDLNMKHAIKDSEIPEIKIENKKTNKKMLIWGVIAALLTAIGIIVSILIAKGLL